MLKAVKITGTGTLLAAKGRLLGVSLVGAAGAGSVVIKDGGSGGANKFDVDTAAGATLSRDIRIPGGGIHFGTDIHATLTNITSLTAFIDDNG